MIPDWPHVTRPLRDWQEAAFESLLAHKEKDFLIVATPGAGKTTMALFAAHNAIKAGRASRIAVVCPTSHLKRQWADAAARVGIQLDPEWSNGAGPLARDYHGVTVTYAQVASNPYVHRRFCQEPTFVILDEIHHSSDENTWGGAIQEAYEPAIRRLALSGTPFRSDNGPIPFVRYVDGQSVADFNYTYADALSQFVCRPVLFPSYEGDMHWYSRGKSYNHTFRDELSRDQASKRLRTALSPNGDWLKEVVRDADRELTRIRETHPDAGGLVVAIDQNHALSIAENLIRPITGEVPAIAISDDPKASDIITEFAQSSRRWVVAVKMLSEGVDVPRLRVGIYATNVQTDMFFRQVVGRFVRYDASLEDQNAYLFIPRDPVLIDLAQEIKEERDHQIQEEIESIQRERSESEAETEDRLLSPWVSISATGTPDDVFFDGQAIDRSEVQDAEAIMKEIGAPASWDAALLALAFRKKIGRSSVTVRTEVRPATRDTPEPIHLRKKRIRSVIGRLVGQLVAARDDMDYADVHKALIRSDGVRQNEATMEQLEARIKTLEAWLKETRDGR